MAMYISLIQFTEQGIRNIKDTIKRGDAAIAEAEKMGMKIIEEFWTMGAYDVVVMVDAPDDETMSAFMLRIGAVGNVKSHTMRAFRRQEMNSQIPSEIRRSVHNETTALGSPLSDSARDRNCANQSKNQDELGGEVTS